ncbi:MAG: tetratricopeptide repeat protein [Planctomycetota bacterium]
MTDGSAKLSRASVALLLLAVTLVFARALGGAFVYDDLTLLAGNPGLHDPWDLVALWTTPLWGEQLGHWRPLTAQLMALGWWLGDGQPWAIHAMALLLHLLAALAVARLWRLGGGPPAMLPGTLAALLFALHPAQAESVAWCAALNDVLAGACALHGLCAWLRFRAEGRTRDLLAAITLAALALAAKEGGAVTPLLYVASDLLRRGGGTHGSARGARFAALWPLLLLPLWWLLRTLVFGDAAGGLDRTTFAHPGSPFAIGAATGSGLVMHLLWPFGLVMFAPVAQVGAAAFALGGLALAGLAALLWRGGARVRTGALLVLAGVVPPMLTTASLGPYPIADRYLYLPCAGLGLLLAAPIASARGPAFAARWTWVLCALVAAFATLSFARLDTWSDQESFVDRALERYPSDPRLHLMRGQLLLERAAGDARELPAATAALQQARLLLGGDLRRQDHLAQVRADVAIGLGWCALLQAATRQRPDWQPVEREFLDLTERWPDRSDPWVALGILRAQTGRVPAAEQAFRRAIELDPGNGRAHLNMAQLLLQNGDVAGARRHLEEALRISPEDAVARQLLERLGGGH